MLFPELIGDTVVCTPSSVYRTIRTLLWMYMFRYKKNMRSNFSKTKSEKRMLKQRKMKKKKTTRTRGTRTRSRKNSKTNLLTFQISKHRTSLLFSRCASKRKSSSSSHVVNAVFVVVASVSAAAATFFNSHFLPAHLPSMCESEPNKNGIDIEIERKFNEENGIKIDLPVILFWNVQIKKNAKPNRNMPNGAKIHLEINRLPTACIEGNGTNKQFASTQWLHIA